MHNQRQFGYGIVVALFGLLVIAVIIVIGVGVARRSLAPSSAATAKGGQAALLGVSLSPASYDAAGLGGFLGKVSMLNGVLEWQGDWNELDRANTGASLSLNNAAQYGYTPLLVVTAFKDAGHSRLTPIHPLTANQIKAYVDAAAAYASRYHPEYFGVGIEVNRIYETSPSDYRAFVGLFNRTVRAVHAASADTKVFTTFQLERLKGLKGGLYGGVNDEKANEWSLLSDFDSADALGFTTYPSLIYKTPGAIPANYYTDIARHTTKPILITEAGWPAADQATGWPSSSEAQATYAAQLKRASAALGAKVTIWSYLYDQRAAVPFSSMGFFSADGSERPGWQVFTNP